MFIHAAHDDIHGLMNKHLLESFSIDDGNKHTIHNINKLITNAYKETRNINITRRIQNSQIIDNKTLLKIVGKTRFFPQEIETFLLHNKCDYKYFMFKMGRRTFHIHAYCYEKSEFDEEHLRYIVSWFYIASRFAPQNKCSRTLHVYLMLSPVKKFIPEIKHTTLAPTHVNSAYTYGCAENNKIVIFRNEEWQKVLLHESFHTYNFDFHANDFSKFKTFMTRTFSVESDFELFETYCETWATIWTCGYNAYNLAIETDRSDLFIEYMETLIGHEQQFSLIQTTKILNVFDLRYTDIIQGRMTSSYKENTNVFCYYVLKSLCLLHINKFLQISKKCMNNPLNIVFDNACELKWIDFFDNIHDHPLTIKYTSEVYNHITMTEPRDDKTNMTSNSTGRMTMFG